jgi:hypothetical protein
VLADGLGRVGGEASAGSVRGGRAVSSVLSPDLKGSLLPPSGLLLLLDLVAGVSPAMEKVDVGGVGLGPGETLGRPVRP